MKKRLVLGVCLLILVIGGLAGWGYWRTHQSLLTPELKLNEISVTSITAEKTEVTIRGIVKNNIPLTLTLDSLEYEMFIDHRPVGKERHMKSFMLKAKDSTEVVLPITIFARDLISVLKDRERENIDSVEYRLEAGFYANLLGRRKFNVTIKKLLPLFHPLRIKADHLGISSLKFSGALLNLRVTVENLNRFAIKAKSIAFELSLADTKLINGTLPGVTEFPAKGVTNLDFPINLSYRAIFEYITKRDEIKYELHLSFRSDMESKVMHNCRIQIESSGTVKSLMKIAGKK